MRKATPSNRTEAAARASVEDLLSIAVHAAVAYEALAGPGIANAVEPLNRLGVVLREAGLVEASS